MKISLTSYDVVGPARGSRSGNAFADRDFVSSGSSPRSRRSALPSSKCQGRRKRSSSRDDSRWRRIVAVPALEPCHSSTRAHPVFARCCTHDGRGPSAGCSTDSARACTRPSRTISRFHNSFPPALRPRYSSSAGRIPPDSSSTHRPNARVAIFPIHRHRHRCSLPRRSPPSSTNRSCSCNKEGEIEISIDRFFRDLSYVGGASIAILNLPVFPPLLFFRYSLRTSFFKIPLSSVGRFDSRYRDEKKSIFLRGGKNSRDVSRQRVEISLSLIHI